MSDYYVITDFETNGLNITKESVPIEIGMILTDDEYNILDSLSMYINPFNSSKKGWEGSEVDAHKVHTIPYHIINDVGISPTTAVELVNQFIETQKAVDKYNTRFIIMSDNSQFEYNAMQKLFELANKSDSFPFHYAAWDVNILINSVQKVMKGRVPHKAIQDAFRVYKAVIRALERNGFRKWEK